VGRDTLGRTSYLRRGTLLDCGWLKTLGACAAASLELSTSTGVVALLDREAGRDDRSDCSDVTESEEAEDDNGRARTKAIGCSGMGGSGGGSRIAAGCDGDGGGGDLLVQLAGARASGSEMSV